MYPLWPYGLRFLAPKREFAGSSLHWISTGCTLDWSLLKCAVLWTAVYGSSATERPLGTIREEKGISSGCLSHRDMASAVESDETPNSFHALPCTF